jgi:hypothetical protein
LQAIQSDHLELAERDIPLVILNVILSTEFDEKGVKHTLYNIISSVGGNFKNANSESLEIIDSLLDNELKNFLSFLQVFGVKV